MIFSQALHNSSKQKRLIWLHGWGDSHYTMLSLAEYFSSEFENYVLDLPGAGQSTVPDSVWGVEKYTNAIYNWLHELNEKEGIKKTYFLGHSFGGKLSVVMASKYPSEIAGVVLIAAAGIKVRRSLVLRLKLFIFKNLGALARIFENKFGIDLRGRWGGLVGSSDYSNAKGVMREILKKTVDETVYEYVKNVACPTLAIYGSQDTVTPTYMGREYEKLITGLKYVELAGFNHCNILTDARFQVQSLIDDFINNRSSAEVGKEFSL